jgi:class 3 adenylate cyclase
MEKAGLSVGLWYRHREWLDRYDYTANGNAVNLASRLCDTAADGQILISKKTYLAVEDQVEASEIGELTLKGIARPVVAYNLAGLDQLR